MKNVTSLLSNFIYSLWYADLPPEVVEQTKMVIADYLAACFAGRRVNAAFNTKLERLMFSEGGSREASVLFNRQKLPASAAAYLNAVYAHGAFLDDGNRKAMGHVGASILSAVFAVAETHHSSPKDIITAINAGYEVFNRLAAGAQPGMLRRGFQASGTVGGIAAAAACAKLLGLKADEIGHAMSLAAVQSAGLMMVTESVQACSGINPGNAARTGVFSAKLAASGVKGPENPLESEMGWFHAMTGKVNEDMITSGLGSEFTIMDSYLMPYPAARANHSVIDAAFELREVLLTERGKIETGEISEIRIRTYDTAIRVAGKTPEPSTVAEAAYSLQYTFAKAFFTGHYRLEDMNPENISSGEKELIKKIRLIREPALENRTSGLRGSTVDLILKDGMKLHARIEVPKGERENPLSWKEIMDKLNMCLDGYYTLTDIRRICDRVKEFDTAKIFTSLEMFLL